MNYDTLQIAGGDEKSFMDWGFSISSISGLKTNQKADTFSGTMVNATIANEAGSPTFPFESQVFVRVNRASITGGRNTFSGGTTKFVGKRVVPKLSASASGQSAVYQFQGPWYDLEQNQYLQLFADTINPQLIGETVLFCGLVPAGAASTTIGILPISVGDQIQAILQSLLDTYKAQGMSPPFQYTGRALTSGTTDYSTTATAPSGADQTDAVFANANLYFKNRVPATPTIDRQLFKFFEPTYITKPLSCADAIKKCLELWPRTNVWFDYTTTDSDGNPLPTLYVSTVDNMPSVMLKLFDGENHKKISITRRDDLVVKAVNIIYRFNNTLNSQNYTTYAIDKWGPNGCNSPLDPSSGLRVINELVDLAGLSRTTVTGYLDCEPLACIGGNNASKRAWWSSKRGGEVASWLDSRIRFQDVTQVPATEVEIPDATLYYADTGQPLSDEDLAFYTNRLVRGSHCAWMTLSSGNAVKSLKVRVSVSAKLAKYDRVAPGDVQNQLPDDESESNTSINGILKTGGNFEEQHANIEITNGVTSTYSTFSSVTTSDWYIIGNGGAAQYLFQHLNVPQFDGDFVKVQTSFDDATSASYVHPGMSLNLSGGAFLWQTMRAQIQEIEEDYGTHQTSIRIGVAKHLSAGQLSSILNMWRFRRPWYNPALRQDNSQAGGNRVALSITNGQSNTTNGAEDTSLIGVSAPFTPRTS